MNTEQGICSFEGMRYTHLDVDFGVKEDSNKKALIPDFRASETRVRK